MRPVAALHSLLRAASHAPYRWMLRSPGIAANSWAEADSPWRGRFSCGNNTREVVAEARGVAEGAVIAVAALCAAAVVAGLVLFGLGMLKAGVLPAVGISLFLGGVVFAMGTEVAEQSVFETVPWLMDVAPPLGFIVAGLGILYVGRAAWLLDGAPEATAAPSPS